MAQLELPDGYTVLNESPASGKPMRMVSGLLDADTKPDTAVILHNPNGFSDYLLLVYLTASQQNITYRLRIEEDMAIAPVPISISKKVFLFGYVYDGTAHMTCIFRLRYNSAARKMQLIGYDGGFAESISQRMERSVNLLTGDYILSRKHVNKKSPTLKKGKTSPMRNIYLDQIDSKLIDRLEGIGNTTTAL